VDIEALTERLLFEALTEIVSDGKANENGQEPEGAVTGTFRSGSQRAMNCCQASLGKGRSP
jgi:hypothetical protein